MALLYANRGFLSVNNQKLVDVMSIELKMNRNPKAAPTMTPDRYNTGITQGQWEIDFNFEIAVEDRSQARSSSLSTGLRCRGKLLWPSGTIPTFGLLRTSS